MPQQLYEFVVDGRPIPLRKFEHLRLVTPARDERPVTVAARLARSSRLALDPSFPPRTSLHGVTRKNLRTWRATLTSQILGPLSKTRKATSSFSRTTF